MCNIVVRYLYNLWSDSPDKCNTPPDTMHSYYNILDYIPCAELYIPVTLNCPFSAAILKRGAVRRNLRDWTIYLKAVSVIASDKNFCIGLNLLIFLLHSL